MTGRRNPFRVVESGESVTGPSKSVKPLTVTEAASLGSARDVYVAMRDRIAVAVENPNTPARDLAALTKRLAETIKEIEAIDARADQEVGGDVEVADGEFDASAV